MRQFDPEDLALAAPENLCLCSTEELLRYCESDPADTAAFGACLAELYVRWFVGKNDEKFETALRKLTPGGVLPAVLCACKVHDALDADSAIADFAEGGARLWNVDAGDRCAVEIERHVRLRIRGLLAKVDGYVPVYWTDGTGRAAFLPFRLVKKTSARQPSALDAAGRKISEWNAESRQILGDGWQMLVAYRPKVKDCPLLSGRSFMLSLLVAKWTHEGTLPRIRPWRLFFSGVMTPTGEVCPVQVEEKSAAVKRNFADDAKLVTPVDEPESEADSGVDPIRANLGGDQLLGEIRARVESVRDCCFLRRYASDRLPSVEYEVRDKTVGNWQRQIARIRNMKRALGKISAPREHLLLLMLESAAHCHCGDTDAALRLNAEARDFAEREGCVYEALRLGVEELVELQDSERFDDVVRLARPLEAQIENAAALSSEERLDLQMRFHGTMGQIETNGALLEIEGFGRDAARSSIDKALECARELDRVARKRNESRESDVLQDLNYRHLWTAFFAPGTECERECSEEMRGFCNGLQDPRVREKNRAYQNRQIVLSAFTAWRVDGTLSRNLCFRVPHGTQVESWIVATTLKMRGALAAAMGRSENAVADFTAAEKRLPFAGWWMSASDDVLCFGPVFAFIRLTILAQAVCSFVQIGLTREAEEYRRLGHELVAAVPRLKERHFASRWMSALDAPVEPSKLPPTYY